MMIIPTSEPTYTCTMVVTETLLCCNSADISSTQGDTILTH